MNKLYRIIWADNLSPFSISLSVRQIRLHWFSHQWPSTHKKSKVCTTYQICTFGAGDYPPSNSNYSVELNETLLGVKRPSEFAKWSKALPHPAPHRSLFWLTWLLDLERVCVIFWCDIKEKDLSWKWLKKDHHPADHQIYSSHHHYGRIVFFLWSNVVYRKRDGRQQFSVLKSKSILVYTIGFYLLSVLE